MSEKNKVLYKDLYSGKIYSELPSNKRIVHNASDLKDEDEYLKQHPTELPEVVIYNHPTTLGGYYDKLNLLTDANLNHALKVKNSDELVHETSAFERIPNLFSPSQYIGAGIDAYKGRRNFGESLWHGNSGIVSDNFALNYPKLATLSNTLFDMIAPYGLKKFYAYGTEPIRHFGTETPLVEYSRFSPRVTKHTTITPSEMHIRNNTTGFVKSTYKGTDLSGLHVYTLPRMWFPKNPKSAFNYILKNATNKGYEVITHPNLEGLALMNKKLNRVISDFGKTGYGQVGWTWKGPGFSDAAFETIPEFKLAMEKNGGKLNGNSIK